jgi:subfamily B ATP-binding cassette protein MsbA
MEAPGAPTLPPLKSHIRFVDVSFSYNRGEKVLEDVNLEVKRDEVVALVGLSGAGKTTLVNLIPRFYDPTSGRIEIDGQDTKEVTLSSLRHQIGIVSQEVILFNDTVANNIAYGKPEAKRGEIVRAAQAANAHDFIRGLPQNYDTAVGEQGATLSGGQRQRLALARAIIKDPAILILDEATSELDSESERLIQEALSRFVRGRTTIIIAHRLSTVTRADRIFVLEGGRIQAVGTHKELLLTSPLYRRLYETQFSLALEG